MALSAYRFVPQPGRGFHLGREGLAQEFSAETFPSDSLFAALVAVLVEVYGTAFTADYLAQWPQENIPAAIPFQLSTLFPYIGGMPLLPMPRLRVNLQDTAQPRGKMLKKLAFVSPVILARLLSGQSMDDWLPEQLGQVKDGILLQDGRVWLSASEIEQLPTKLRRFNEQTRHEEKLWSSSPVPRVAIDRVTNSSSIYQMGRTVFAEDCGLWLLANIHQDGDMLDELLLHLSDRGIGGERSAGYGAFTLEPWNSGPALPEADGQPQVMTLARYSPTLAELQAGVLGENAAYELVDVGGWLSTPGGPAQRRQRVRMVEAGSVLQAVKPLTGQLVDVRPRYEAAGAPDHPVYRSGIALTIGVAGGTNG